jgi:creatinine amidohydrolase
METNANGEKIFYADYTWYEMEAMDRANTVLVLPTGSVEEHGPHLTLASDSTAAETVTRAAAKKVSGAVVMPCLWYTPALDTSNYTGTVSISSVNFINYLSDIMLSLYRHGFRKLIIANIHGGAKSALDVAVREFHARMGAVDRAYADDFFIQMHNLYVPTVAPLTEISEGKDWGHACEMETSLDLFVDPERVKMDKAVEEYIPWQKGFEWYIGDMRAANKSGVHGDATKASVEKGKIVFNLLVGGLVEIIEGMKTV